ncbi:sodium/hydrogen exchanger 10-like isoform X2 [Tribolium madens]|nr:sodium/hydrogen exchanger 10-like isoform X2 [Tribolium madens]
MLRLLKESGHRTKYVSILLEGETLLSVSIAVAFTQILGLHIGGWIAHWYQWMMGLVRTLVVALPLGCLFGVFGIFLMKLSYTDTPGLLMVTVSMCYMSYFVVHWITNAGIPACTICGIFMGRARATLSKEREESIIDFWKMVVTIMCGILFVVAGVIAPIILRYDTQLKDYILVLVTYLMANVTRFLSFFLFSPILSRTGYGLSFQNMVICVWGGLKNPLILNLAVDLTMKVYLDNAHQRQILYLHVVGLYLLMLFINATFIPVLLRSLGLMELSLSRRINMNNCLKFINEARSRTIAILKMDRFLSDANWPLVSECTTLEHPYRKKTSTEAEQEEEEEDEYLLSYKFTFCPDCQKEVPNEPSPKEMKDMMKEAKLRILKLKKTAYSRQYENGMISRHAIRTMHQAVEIAMDSQEATIELDGLYKLFEKEAFFFRFLRNHLQKILKNKGDQLKPPRLEWRLWCYRIVTHVAFTIFINMVVLIQTIFIIYYFATKVEKHHVMYIVIVNADIFFFIMYLTEFLFKIFAYSWILVCRHGFRTYFRSCCNVLEFIILIAVFALIIFHGVINLTRANMCYYVDLAVCILLGLRLLRVLKLVNYLAFCRRLPVALTKYLDAKVDKHRALAFELGKCYITGEEEILENLHQIVDNDKIRESIREGIENDRLAITKRLGLAQKESPWVTTTVKTRLAMRTVLNSLKDDIYELKLSGWVDDLEYDKLLKSLSKRYKYVDAVKLIPPPTSKAVFKEISYMGDEPELIEFLYTNLSTKKFDPGEVVVKEGENLEGIYILISGMMMVSYTPHPLILDNLKEKGSIPVVDHICSLTYDEPMSEYIVPGNSIGELSILSGRGYDGKIISETHSQVYVLYKPIIKTAMEMDDDPVNGLESRIWKYISFKRALTVMMNVPSFRSLTQQNLKYTLERSFIPNLSNYKVFVINEMMEDIILIEGLVVDFNTRDVYAAPCYIPRACQRLILPRSSFANFDVIIETKLLIIPAKDFDEYEIMIHEEKTCELVSNETSKCLQHLIQTKASLSARVAKHKKSGVPSLTKNIRRKMAGGIDSTKSKMIFMASKSRMSTSSGPN